MTPAVPGLGIAVRPAGSSSGLDARRFQRQLWPIETAPAKVWVVFFATEEVLPG